MTDAPANTANRCDACGGYLSLGYPVTKNGLLYHGLMYNLCPVCVAPLVAKVRETALAHDIDSAPPAFHGA